MEKIRAVAEAIKLYPRIKLGIKDGNKVTSTGPHVVKFLEEPQVIMGKDQEGKPRKEFKFILEESDKWYRWHVPILNSEGQPNYLVERLIDIEVGDVRVLEMKKRGRNNYVDISVPGEPTEQEVEDKFVQLEKEQIGDMEDVDPTDKQAF